VTKNPLINSGFSQLRGQGDGDGKAVQEPFSFGRIHEALYFSLRPRSGETLSTAEILALVDSSPFGVNLTSVLPGDHAAGNHGSCRCSGSDFRLFDQVRRGLYRVRNLSSSLEPIEDLRLGLDIDVDRIHEQKKGGRVLFSQWLETEGLARIQARLRGFRVEILSGLRTGRYLAVGVTLRRTGESWSIGLDKNFDFELGQVPVKAPYCGWRGGSTRKGAGSEGRQTSRILRQIFPEEEWQGPHQHWSLYRYLPVTGDGSEVLSPDAYADFAVQFFVETFATLLNSSTKNPLTTTPMYGDSRPASTDVGDRLESLRRGIEVWREKSVTDEWPSDFHNAMYRMNDLRLAVAPFSPSWWDESIMTRVVAWRAYRPVSAPQIRQWALPLLEELEGLYYSEIEPLLNVPFEDLEWGQLERFTELVAKAKRDVHGNVQGSPVFRSKVCHWIAPRLFPVADQAMLGVRTSYEVFWRDVQSEWRRIELSKRAELRSELQRFIQLGESTDIWDVYPFEVKIIELVRMGERRQQRRI
jgi:hypothetical protein